MTTVSPDHPAVRRLALAICEGLAAWQELMRLQVPSQGDGAGPQCNLPSDTQARLLKPKEAQELLGIGEQQMYELLHANKIRQIRHGRVFRIPPKALEEYIEANSTAGDN